MCLPYVEESSCRAALWDSAGVPVQRKASSSFSDVSQKGSGRNVTVVCGRVLHLPEAERESKSCKQFYLTK